MRGRMIHPRAGHEDDRGGEEGAPSGQFAASNLSFHRHSQIPAILATSVRRVKG